MRSSPRARSAWHAFTTRSVARRSPEETRYTAYVVLLTAAVVAVPVAGAARTWLLTSGLLDAAVSTAAAAVAVGCGAAALLVALGAVRGPVIGEPFVLATLSDTELPGRHTFRRPWAVSLVVVLVSALGAAVVVASAVAPAQGAVQAAAVLLGAAGTAAAAAVAWLAGQVLPQGWAWPVVLGLAVPAVAGASHVAAGGAERMSATSALTIAAVGGVGLVLLACAPTLLDHLPAGRVLSQSRAWATARVRASSGDLHGAVGTFRAVPTVGRHLRATAGHAFVPAIVRADGVGALRTPFRCATGFVALAGSGWASVAATTSSSGPRWLLAALAAVLAFAGAGVFCNGLRHAVLTLAGPRTYGGSDATLVTAHAIVPGLTALLAVSCGGVLRAFTDGRSPSVTSLAVAATVAAGAVVLRVYDSAKGHPPMWVYSPVPTPAGDLSAVTVVLWQSDAVVVTVALAILAVGGATVWQPAAASVMVGAIAVSVLVLFARRLERL